MALSVLVSRTLTQTCGIEHWYQVTFQSTYEFHIHKFFFNIGLHNYNFKAA